jgi:DNA-binding protein H-NS
MLDADSTHHSLSIIAKTSDASSDALDLESISVDELWKLHEAIEVILAEKIPAEIIVLQRHLDRLSPKGSSVKSSKSMEADRRPVLPKYRNPEKPSETWTGRGRRPSWINAQLGLGVHLENLMTR